MNIQKLSSQADFVSIRYSKERTHFRGVRNEKFEHSQSKTEQGAMIEVMMDGHLTYAATSDISEAGIQSAFQKAKSAAIALAKVKAFPFHTDLRPATKGSYKSPRKLNLDQTSLKEIFDVLFLASEKLKVSDKIINRVASAMIVETEQHYLSSTGADIHQEFLMVSPNFEATAEDGSEHQSRSNAGGRSLYQMGPEAFNKDEILKACQLLGEEALELLHAEDCPNEILDLVLYPDQMALQIHESIGHPLELDRILGDERNYAGWSFVQASDFGKLQYGSKLMNICFDPHVEGELASYAFDDGGSKATKEYLIKDGILVRGLGSLESQYRLKQAGWPIQGVANFRSASWNRAPIDRMANINMDWGDSSFDEIIGKIKKGVLMKTNKSWSIDDYRNKFQFGCEYAKLIEDGKITKTLKNPNYRGKTISFWNSLESVGDKNTWGISGSPYCGKGEPNQIIRVGHASPICHFKNIELFGGHK